MNSVTRTLMSHSTPHPMSMFQLPKMETLRTATMQERMAETLLDTTLEETEHLPRLHPQKSSTDRASVFAHHHWNLRLRKLTLAFRDVLPSPSTRRLNTSPSSLQPLCSSSSPKNPTWTACRRRGSLFSSRKANACSS